MTSLWQSWWKFLSSHSVPVSSIISHGRLLSCWESFQLTGGSELQAVVTDPVYTRFKVVLWNHWRILPTVVWEFHSIKFVVLPTFLSCLLFPSPWGPSPCAQCQKVYGAQSFIWGRLKPLGSPLNCLLFFTPISVGSAVIVSDFFL